MKFSFFFSFAQAARETARLRALDALSVIDDGESDVSSDDGQLSVCSEIFDEEEREAESAAPPLLIKIESLDIIKVICCLYDLGSKLKQNIEL